LLLLAVWASAATWSAYTAAQELESARGSILAAEQELRDLDLAGAQTEIAAAVNASSTASDQLSAVHLGPLGILPWVGPNLEAARVLSAAARDVGHDAGSILSQLAGSSARSEAADESAAEGGVVPLEALTELGRATRTLAATLEEHGAAVRALDPAPLVQRSAAARELFLDIVEPNIDTVELAADALELLPDLLGADEPRTYLVGAASLSELRGSGGLLGSWSVMTAHEGTITLDEFVDVDDLPRPDGPVPAPSQEFADRYAGFRALSNYRNVNYSPDFPSVAHTLLRMHEAGGGAELDGVIIADTVVFERLAASAGGVDIPEVGFLEPSEVLSFVALDAYDTFESDDDRKRVLGNVAAATFQELLAVLEGDDIVGNLRVLSELLRDQHLRFFAHEPHYQRLARRGGFSGALPDDTGESVGLFLNNLGQNKLDYFARRSIEHRVRLGEAGSTHADIRARLGNDAPTEGHRRYVLGPWVDGLSAGDTRWLATVSCGIGCRLEEAPSDDHVGGTERGRTMHDHVTTVRSDEHVDLHYRATTPDAWTQVDDQVVVRIQHLAQPTLHGTDLRLILTIPDDHDVVDATDGASVEGDEIVWHYPQRSGPVSVEARFEAGRNH